MERGTVIEEAPLSPSWLLVSSPRRTLSLLRERPVEKAPGFAEEHGPKPSEVYGFVGSITTVITTVIFLVWAYTPEPCLHYLGITYYPSKYWALAVPAFCIVMLVLTMAFYLGLNFMVTPPPTSLNTMFVVDADIPKHVLVNGVSIQLFLTYSFFEKDVIPSPIRPNVRSIELHPYSTGACTLISPGDEYSRERSTFTFSGREQPIDPISDIGISQINDLMFW